MAKGKQAKAAEVIDADAALIQAIPELVPTRDESMTIGEFIRSLTPFFMTARALELAAKATLERARADDLRFRSVPPKTADEDARIQSDIRQSSADKKKVEDHWTITAVLFNFQRRLVGARKRATDALEEAATIWQRHHNTYADNERRKAQAETDRLRREQEAQAQRDRDAELARLEQLAVDAEAKSADLSEREQRFVEHYMRTGNGILAARSAGFQNPSMQAPRLLSMQKIMAACDAKKRAEVLREQKAAVKETPLDVQTTEVKPNVTKVGTDRTTKSAEIFDARLLIEAVIGGRHGIPADVLMPDPVRLNQYARDMGDVINRWPGVRLKKDTKTI